MVERKSLIVNIEMKRALIKYFNPIKKRIKKIKFLCSDNIIVLNALEGVSIIELIVDQRSRLKILSRK
jgi:hypothetical protein